jgi:YaiO family outer membrane protein
LTNGFPPWAGAYLRLITKAGGRDTLYLEVLRQREFGDTGTYFSAADSHTLNDDWYWFAAVAGSSGGFFFPALRVDAQLNKKWLARRQLVTSFGGGYFKAKDAHRDSSVSIGGIYYFQSPWVVQGGVRWNRSMPGEVISRSQFVAVSRGRQGQRYLVFRAGTGREAYQALAPGEVLVDFPSRDVSATWKQWLGEDWGFNSSAEYYRSRVYQRVGASFGIFKSF